ncbi:MAG TPA: glycoside hydrolase family 2 TIM barrel-domain containing protein [Chloroflexia bacterium]
MSHPPEPLAVAGQHGGYSIASLPPRWRLRDDNPNEWIWTPRAQRRHDLSQWLEVPVPMSVQEALWRTGQLPHPYRDLNSRLAEWVEHRDWVYGLDFPLPPPPPGTRVFIEFESVADARMLFLNGTLVGEHEGPGAPFAFEIGPALREDSNQLLLVVRAPHQEDPQTGWTGRTASLRGRMGFGWDFAPRLVSLGILGEVKLRHTGPWKLRHLWARPTLSENLLHATIDLSVQVDGPPGAEVRFIISRGRQTVASETASVGEDGLARATVELARPDLWWPNGMGTQPLYSLKAECASGSDALSSTFGIRDVAWEGRPGGSAEEWPLTLAVNGRRVFQRGWNWVPADSMGGPRAVPLARKLLRLAKEARVNFLRCWGGADPETRAFYDECDRLGILVWQEFALSSAGISNVPPTDPAYLYRLDTYARDVVAARRNHPSLALWGGGNELTGDDGKPLTMDHPYPQRLAAVVAAHDPSRAFRPSSPLGPAFDADPEHGDPNMWDVHGPWEYSQRWPGPQYWRFNAVRPILHSETGAPGEASLAMQRRYLSPAHRAPRLPTNPARRHHGGAWWDHSSTVEQLFGPIEDEELAVLASQWLQAETLRYYIEETRRRWPESVGIYPWQLNEPWPNVACTSAVEYGGKPKLAYFAVRGAYRSLLLTAHYRGLPFSQAQPLRAEIWALNDGPALEAEMEVSFTSLDGEVLAPGITQSVPLSAASSTRILDIAPALVGEFEGVVILGLSLGGARNRYIFSSRQEHPLRDTLRHPQLLKDMFATQPDAHQHNS